MRQIVLDTETTGLEVTAGHRIIEIGCVELINRKFTGNNFHCYLNPEREIDVEAQEVHGITNEFLADKPNFAQISTELLSYLGSAELLAHNAPFDIGFLDAELSRLTPPSLLISQHFTIVDTLEIARKKFPGQRNTLDALCKRYQISLDEREKNGHGALLDAELLAKVYLLMTGGQSTLFEEHELFTSEAVPQTSITYQHTATPRKTKLIYATPDELIEHRKILSIMPEQATALWDELYDNK